MKVHYDKDEDILMIELARKKVDDAYETDQMIVHVTEDREPVLLEIFKASKFLKDLGKVVPQNLQKEVWSKVYSSVPHRIRSPRTRN
ncbi:hypothetical protein A3F02_03690 [Candidatus Curtissbacteria bacterium RIFCSPHIGHO2_12_FULL_38_9b]|uniref:DUF2283 domain-containing protein n=2 Tax=Candidatus Curtissiibacteriota TaxID=1752717 RepID=A0A1F5H0G7_9BACT|nr:MAG: hypothetical protein A3A48_01595 [Candidatus Curtissbacteria bacterium RIFCSPLOWO2_01_FULL_37_9]OGD97559.1 MAG: hypothetical protein A3F02_03690 [Candidatus Curtissbacteria bacterium RIFCSPHIGHO2_12_FULL_38_9b]